ncbi:ABC transporter substrate-binding protein [Actinoallomurus purpureus]|uniref:ABC transporter substrate-binding protein n=1 Tax=Actinoallomurus purpureus TaxID=478114 RepID=UPI0020923C1D|nr:ABC transporter substrate-binding protein [Actinoallomurus purpureus]MCO6005265.1 ABC transporter substrate-binding protein [Actinoallomurus purpureus]
MKARDITWRAAVAAIALITSASACSAASTDSAGGGGKAAGPKIRLAVGIDPSYAPFFLADEKGLFAKQGVNVEVVQFGKGGDADDAIASGQVQLAGSSDTTAIGKLQQNPDLRALLVYESSGKYLKVVERKNIGDPSQIKKMAIVPGLSELAATRFLESKKIDPKKVTFVTADPPEIPALMQKGNIDAYVLWEPWPTKGAQLGGKIVETTGDYGLSYGQWLIAGNKWLSANQSAAAKVAKALDEAAKLTESDPQAAAQATQKAAKVPADQTVTAIKEIDFGVRDITAADLKGYDATADFYLRTGKVKAKPNVTAAVLQNWFSGHAAK